MNQNERRAKLLKLDSARTKKPAKKGGKDPLVVAWKNWKRSDTGRKCLTGTASGVYLENRLWWAFMDGADSAAS